MKKLITLFLAIAGCVGTVSADDTYTVVGSSALIFGNTWDVTDSEDANKMQLCDDGYYRITYPNITFAESGSFSFKVVKNHAYSGEGHGSWPSSDYVQAYSAGTYDITIVFSPSGVGSVNCKLAGDMYLIYQALGGGSWKVGDKLSRSNGVYTTTIDGSTIGFFALSSESLTTGEDYTSWASPVRPNDAGDYYLYVQHMFAGTSTSTSGTWKIAEKENYSFTYNSIYDTFTIDAEASGSIGGEGWRTYSTGNYTGSNGYRISGLDVTAYYVSSTGAGKAMLTSIPTGTVIPTKAGVMLKGSGSFTVTTTDESPATLSGNMLVGSGSESADVPTSTGYILANEASGLGFYPVSDSEYSLAAHKAYLNVTSGARTFISFEEATGINNINVEEVNAPIYNLQGIRLNQAQKGLNIINGKIVLKK